MLLHVLLVIIGLAITAETAKSKGIESRGTEYLYLISKDKVAYNKVWEYCEEKGGFPAFIDKETWDYIKFQMKKFAVNEVYVAGGYDGKKHYYMNPIFYLNTNCSKSLQSRTSGWEAILSHTCNAYLQDTTDNLERYAMCQRSVDNEGDSDE